MHSQERSESDLSGGSGRVKPGKPGYVEISDYEFDFGTTVMGQRNTMANRTAFNKRSLDGKSGQKIEQTRNKSFETNMAQFDNDQ